MFLDDNGDEFKTYQSDFRKLETQITQQKLNTELNKVIDSRVTYENKYNLEKSKYDSFINELDSLNNLLEFDISGNLLTSLPENISNLENLFSLDISGNNIEVIPSSFANLINLEVLKANNNSLILLPEVFENLNELREINLSYNAIINSIENFINET